MWYFVHECLGLFIVLPCCKDDHLEVIVHVIFALSHQHIMIFVLMNDLHILIVVSPFLEIKNVVGWPMIRLKIVLILEVRASLININDKSVSTSHGVN